MNTLSEYLEQRLWGACGANTWSCEEADPVATTVSIIGHDLGEYLWKTCNRIIEKLWEWICVTVQNL
jgi:hypothetical protein